MVSHLHKNIITNAIRVLRARRVRPSLKKIAWLVQREHSLSEKSLLALIESLVETKDILRVHFKGAISYRIPPTCPGASSVDDNSFESELVEYLPSNLLVKQDLHLSSESDTDESDRQNCSSGGGGGMANRNDRSGNPSYAIHQARRGVGGGVRGSRARGGMVGCSATTGVRGTPSGSAPKPRLHAGAQTLTGVVDVDVKDININDTISRVIITNGSTSSNSSQGSATGSVTPKSGRSTPTSECDGNEGHNTEFETPCAPPRAAVRGARRGRPPLSTIGFGDCRKARQPSARQKVRLRSQLPKVSAISTKFFGTVQRAKRVFDPSEGSIIELSNSPVLAAGASTSNSAGALQYSSPATTGDTSPGNTYPYTPSSRADYGAVGGSGGSCSSGGAAKRRSGVIDGINGGHENSECSTCDICQGSETQAEYLLRCINCSTAGHPSCLGYNAVLAERSRGRPWTCMDCKHCVICNMDHLIGTLIFCDECDRAFHLTCHHPTLTTQPQGTWVCCYCCPQPVVANGYDSVLYQPGNSGGGFPLTPRDSPIPDDESRGSSGSWGAGVGYDPSIPNATLWSVDDVVAHFEEKGFEEEAHVFRERALDGSAVLLLCRSDVLTGLGLRLGPALKLYRQVRVLQTRLPHPPTLC